MTLLPHRRSRSVVHDVSVGTHSTKAEATANDINGINDNDGPSA